VGWIYFPFALTTSLALCPITGLEARRRRRSHGHVGLLRSPAVEYLEFPGLGVGLGTFGISSCVIVHPETAHGSLCLRAPPNHHGELLSPQVKSMSSNYIRLLLSSSRTSLTRSYQCSCASGALCGVLRMEKWFTPRFFLLLHYYKQGSDWLEARSQSPKVGLHVLPLLEAPPTPPSSECGQLQLVRRPRLGGTSLLCRNF
jgi:hypothetical protein